jgi:HSP20 family protein
MTETKAENKNIEVQRTAHKKRDNEMESTLVKAETFLDTLNRWFDDIWNPFSFSLNPKWFERSNLRMPLSNIKEEEYNYKIEAELPGLNKDDIQITLSDGLLKIKGEKTMKTNIDEEGYLRKEFKSTKYLRKFQLPVNVNEDEIDASLKNGRLEIILPKVELEMKDVKSIKIK